MVRRLRQSRLRRFNRREPGALAGLRWIERLDFAAAGGRINTGISTGSVGLERPLDRHADIGRLLVAELGELDADLVEVQPRDLLVELLGQRVDLLLVLAGLGPAARSAPASGW